jgi:hypothetical protein
VTGRTSNWAPPAAVRPGGGPKLSKARRRCNPRRLYDWVEIATALPPDLVGKVLISQAAMRVLHEVARLAKQVE